jgi:serine/threonine protein kinase
VDAKCPHCDFDFNASSGRSGKRSVCPRCQKSFDAFAVGDTLQIDRTTGAPQSFGPRSPVGSAVGQQFEEYCIVEEIGRGGMGVVYRAVQETLDRPVALKMILTGEDAGEEEVQLFLREATAAARLRHPNIVTVYELDVHEGIYYYTMDYIDGKDLDALIGERGMNPREAARIAEKVARALQHAHERGIVHRDLKPGNIIVEESGEPVITDFGLARDARYADGDGTEVAGTPAYMAPEQVLGFGRLIGPSCDVYSLGALIYEMLTGLPPFDHEETKRIFEAIVKEQPRPPQELRSELDPELCDLVLKCLRKNPEERHGSAGELADALAAWLERDGERRPVPEETS